MVVPFIVDRPNSIAIAIAIANRWRGQLKSNNKARLFVSKMASASALVLDLSWRGLVTFYFIHHTFVNGIEMQ